jgi:hypothetical protein
MAFPLFLIAAAGWSTVDDPLVNLKDWGVGNYTPLWLVADTVIHACIRIVVLAIILGAVVVALLRARRRRAWAAAGNMVAAAIVVTGPAVLFSGIASHPDSPLTRPQLDLLALALSVLAGIAILANAAARASLDHRTARLMVVPAALLSIVLLATFVAFAAYGSDLAIIGVPLAADPTLGAHAYPINTLPPGFADWLPTLTGSVVAGLAALSCAAYAMVGAIRGALTKAEPEVARLIELDIAPS